MNQTNPKYHSLGRRIVLIFCGFTLVLSFVYGGFSILLMYALEDSFIEQELATEASYLSKEFELNGQWPTPRRDHMQLHFSRDTFPEDFRAIAIEEPRRKEFFGQQQRHYHLYPLEGYTDTFLVAEVSGELQVRKIRDSVIKFLVVSGLIVTFIACLIAWYIGRKTAKPLQELADLVHGVAPENIPNQFAHQFPNNEVGRLATTLEHTLTRIAQALEREKYFTRDVSHELRTPLAVIKNAIELKRAQNLRSKLDNNSMDGLDRIYQATEQMEKTVQTLLILSRERQPQSALPMTEMMPIIEQSILDNRLRLEGKPVEVKVRDGCYAKVRGNGDMLKVLLDNLLSNAFHFTESGAVTLDFENDCLSVADTGPGIEPQISGNVTEIGVKGRNSSGYGLGLSIVKRLCEHQGWTMAVSSDNGTTVKVCFGSA